MVFLRDEPKKQDQRSLVMGWAVPAPGAVRTTWEYRSLQTDGMTVTTVNGDTDHRLVKTSISQALEMMGADEWELAAVRDTPQGPLYVFKRPGGSA